MSQGNASCLRALGGVLRLMFASIPTRLPNKASIFRAELHAISLALSLIRRSKEKDFIIFSDSMSSLEAISGFKLEIDMVQNIIKDYTHLANTGKAIILCWIPSHVNNVNIRGNERADTAAKSALSLPITPRLALLSIP